MSQPLPCIVPHNRLTYSAEEEDAVLRVVRSGRWTSGVEVTSLEAEICKVAGVPHAVGVGSGLGALRLALHALGIGPGSRVAVPAYSCVALANAILVLGATPVPLDVSHETWVLSAAAVAKELAAGRSLDAAIVVHTFGQPGPVTEIEALGVPVIEDCSHAFGMEPLGRLGRLAILSLHATKLLGAGEGGLVLTIDEALARQIRSARDYADQAPAPWRLNDRMTDITAAIARCQLRRLPWNLARRDELAARYHTRLAGLGCEPPSRTGRRVWYRYAVSTAEAAQLIPELQRRGVAAALPVENWCLADPPLGEATAPVAARAFRHLLSLPLYPTLTEVEQDLVIASLDQTLTQGHPK